MTELGSTRFVAFEGSYCIAFGGLDDVVRNVKRRFDEDPGAQVFVFNDETGLVIDFDLRGPADEVVKRAHYQLEPEKPVSQGPGRPKLGVVAREVTLLPRHWEWLNSQPGGASVALRKLVEEARKTRSGKDRIRQAQEVSYRFIKVMAGDLPGFEEASRALFAGNKSAFDELANRWPTDVRDHSIRLAQGAFEVED